MDGMQEHEQTHENRTMNKFPQILTYEDYKFNSITYQFYQLYYVINCLILSVLECRVILNTYTFMGHLVIHLILNNSATQQQQFMM